MDTPLLCVDRRVSWERVCGNQDWLNLSDLIFFFLVKAVCVCAYVHNECVDVIHCKVCDSDTMTLGP